MKDRRIARCPIFKIIKKFLSRYLTLPLQKNQIVCRPFKGWIECDTFLHASHHQSVLCWLQENWWRNLAFLSSYTSQLCLVKSIFHRLMFQDLMRSRTSTVIRKNSSDIPFQPTCFGDHYPCVSVSCRFVGMCSMLPISIGFCRVGGVHYPRVSSPRGWGLIWGELFCYPHSGQISENWPLFKNEW